MTHRHPSDQNEAVRQWSRRTDPVERAMTRQVKYVDALSFMRCVKEGYSPVTGGF
jgi:hypothetical protein